MMQLSLDYGTKEGTTLTRAIHKVLLFLYKMKSGMRYATLTTAQTDLMGPNKLCLSIPYWFIHLFVYNVCCSRMSRSTSRTDAFMISVSCKSQGHALLFILPLVTKRHKHKRHKLRKLLWIIFCMDTFHWKLRSWTNLQGRCLC